MAGRVLILVLGGNPEMLAMKIMHEKHKQTVEENKSLLMKYMLN